MPIQEKAQRLTQLEAPKKLNRAGYAYIGDLLYQLLNEIENDQEDHPVQPTGDSSCPDCGRDSEAA